jgi:hypothetical protein
MPLDLKQYMKISTVLFFSFLFNFVILLAVNIKFVEAKLLPFFGQIALEGIKQFFYGALAATISCSLFVAKDKDINELELLKSPPDPSTFRLPDIFDKRMYIQRIICSGILAVLGLVIILAGFSYLEVNYEKAFTAKHKLLFVLSSFLIGLNQSKFLARLEKLFDQFFKEKKS